MNKGREKINSSYIQINEWTHYYKQLLTESIANNPKYIAPEQSQETIQIIKEEVQKAICSLKNYRSSGLPGK